MSPGFSDASTVAQVWQVANIQKGWAFLISHKACFCKEMACQTAIKVPELM